MLRHADHPEAGAFGWELDKAAWQSVQSDRVEIQIPKKAIMLLKQ